MSRGKFITIEGVEGVGKSTNVRVIADWIESAGHEVLVTREPGGTALGERVREILLDGNEQSMAPMTELLLMFAARAQHVEEVIKPALAEEKWVVCDRFTDSSFAYQGGGRNIGSESVAGLEQLVLGDFRPDLVIVLDLDIQLGLQRATRNGDADRFEQEAREFFDRVRSAFLERAKLPGYRLVDASLPVDEVGNMIVQVLAEEFK